MCKVGGEIVYSTCTITLEENELLLNKILKKYPVELIDIELPLKCHEAFTSYQGEELNPQISKTRRIVPWEINSEGFFVAKLRKIAAGESSEKYPRKEKKFELLKSSNNKIKKIIEELSGHFGIESEIFDNYKYLFRNEDIYFMDKNWESDNLEMYMRIGSKLGSIDKHQSVYLHTLGAQTFGSNANDNVVNLQSLSELETYFGGRIIKRDFGSAGQKIVNYNDYVLGTAVASSEGLKSQFPRAFRTQEIVFK